MIYAGVDPGAQGAIAIFNDFTLIDVLDISFETFGKQKTIDVSGLACEILDVAQVSPLDHVFIEEVASRTGQGVKSMFSFGERFGEMKCLGLTLSSSLVFLPPRKWKASAGLIGQDKIESAKKCARLYPDKAELFVEPNNRCKDGYKYYDGRGDAALIGLMGYKGVK